MQLDLSELHQRLDFARDQITLIEKAAKEFEAKNVEAHFSHAKLDDGWLSNVSWDVYVLQKAPVPVTLRSHAGMVANELRATLDALACSLAIRNGKPPSKTYFAISKSRQIFDDDGMRKLSALAPGDRQRIAELQPWRGGDPVLWPLHEADRTRKHQRLGACGVGKALMRFSANPAFGPEISTPLSIDNVKVDGVTVRNMWWDPARLARLEVGRRLQVAGNVPMAWRSGFKFEVAYADPSELAGRGVVSTLKEFADKVEAILKMFDQPG